MTLCFLQRPFFLSGPPNLGVPRLYPPNKLCGPCFRSNPSAEPGSKQLGGWATKTVLAPSKRSSRKLLRPRFGLSQSLRSSLVDNCTAVSAVIWLSFQNSPTHPRLRVGRRWRSPITRLAILKSLPPPLPPHIPPLRNGILQQHAFLNRCLACIPRASCRKDTSSGVPPVCTQHHPL